MWIFKALFGNVIPMAHTTIYLDYNATAPLRPIALQAITAAHQQPLNASSIHSFGRTGRKHIEDARAILSNAITCPAAQITFNSGATEGNNTIIQHIARTHPNERILISATEHPSLLDIPAHQATPIPTLPNGQVDVNALETLLRQDPRTALVCVMLANNETGIIQPIAEISRLAHKHGALLHCDATQALGRIPINMQTLGIDSLSLSAHKIGGPQGIGALAIGLCGITPCLLHGGGQEKKRRAGTENVAGIAGFGAAIKDSCTPSTLQTEHTRLSALQRHLETELKTISPTLTIHGEHQKRLPNTTLFSLPGAHSESLLIAFDLAGIALSNGSACSSGTVKTSHVLSAMNISPHTAQAAIRISTGWATQDSDITAALNAWKTIAARQNR